MLFGPLHLMSLIQRNELNFIMHILPVKLTVTS